jgi:hypothetical protein
MKQITPGDLIKAAEAVAEVTGQTHIFVVGMASTVFTIPTIQAPLTDDVDLFTPDAESCALDEVIAALGEGSSFENRHGFYVERLGRWVLLTQPSGWMERAFVVPHPTLTIRALHPLDLVYNKLEAGRKKDLEGVRRILKGGTIHLEDVEQFIEAADTPTESKQAIRRNLETALRKR